MKREANFQTYFNKWVQSQFRGTAAFELKQTKTDSLPFSAVVHHQRQALAQVKHQCFVYKIVDCGYQNPFDSFVMTKQPAFVVIKYPTFFCLIDIDKFNDEALTSQRKSLTADRAKKIAYIVVM